MPAYDEILSFSSKTRFNDFRQSLVAHKKGMLSNGAFPRAMSIVYLNGGQDDIFQEGPKEPGKIFLRNGNVQSSGIVLDKNGTDRAISVLTANGTLKLLEDYSGMFRFVNPSDKETWGSATKLSVKRCISRNIEEMIKKTEINYRTHGDRLHYFVSGLVEIVESTGNTLYYPLFLFSCSELNKNTLRAEIEQTGFANFWLDKNVLSGLIASTLGNFEISLDDEFTTKLNMMSSKINNLQMSGYDSFKVDPEYSALTIVTGFEAEYIDPAWAKILEGINDAN